MVITAAGVLKDARLRAGLTQSQLSKKASMTQSVISAYESGRRDPSLSTLNKLVAAAGFALNIGLAKTVPEPGNHASILRERRLEIIAAFEDLGATNIRVFGSVARGEDQAESDIDLLVDLKPGTGLFGLAKLIGVAEGILGVSVDVVPAIDLKPSTSQEILQQAVPL